MTMDGVLIIDKPAGPTSHDVVSEVKKLLGAKKVGHLGTLDPAASGVLPLVIDKATKSAVALRGDTKVYEFDLVLGAKTDTDDDCGRVISEAAVPADVQKKVEALITKFVGEIMQVPPAYSAVKIGGKPLYKIARKGRTVDVKSRNVRVHELKVLDYYNDGGKTRRVRMHLACSAGTYVRALCRDLGLELGCFGFAANIRRLQSGPYKIEEAVPLELFSELSAPERQKRIKPLTFQTIS